MRDDQIIDPQRLAALRRLKNLPQQKIAKAIGRSQGYYSCAERGLVSLTQNEQRIVARLLGMPGGKL